MDALLTRWMQAPGCAKLAILIALPTAGFVTARLMDEYRGWLGLGPGGLPYNISGYLTNLLVTALFAKGETKSLGLYDQPEKFAPNWNMTSNEEKVKAQKSFLKEALPGRAGPQSNAKHFCAPQREKNVDEYIDPDLKKAYLEAFDSLAEKHSDAIEWKTSVLEKRGKAMFLKEAYAIPTLIAKCKREVAHIHESDMSAHLLLSLGDAKEVIEKGWGERHRMSGSAVVPLGYTLLYQPRKTEELDTFMRIFEAGIEYAKSNGKESAM